MSDRYDPRMCYEPDERNTETLVGPGGLEPPASSVSRKRSTSELRARNPTFAGVEATSGIEPE